MNTLKTAWIQTKAEFRVNYSSISIIAHLGVPVFFVVIFGWVLGDIDAAKRPVIIGVLFSSILSFAVLSIFNLFSECYSERISGNFVRIRTLPHGTSAWMIGKVIFQVINFLIALVIGVIAVAVILPDVGLQASTALGLIAIGVLGVVAFAPIGLIVGMTVQSIQGFMVAMAVCMGLFVVTGGFFPMGVLPKWVEYASLLSPFYWMGYSGRVLQLGAAGAEYELLGIASLPLGLGVIVAGGVIGWLLGPRIVHAMMRKETIGQLTKQRDNYRAVSGV